MQLDPKEKDPSGPQGNAGQRQPIQLVSSCKLPRFHKTPDTASATAVGSSRRPCQGMSDAHLNEPLAKAEVSREEVTRKTTGLMPRRVHGDAPPAPRKASQKGRPVDTARDRIEAELNTEIQEEPAKETITEDLDDDLCSSLEPMTATSCTVKLPLRRKLDKALARSASLLPAEDVDEQDRRNPESNPGLQKCVEANCVRKEPISGTHSCLKCQGFMHAWCGKPAKEDEEGYGAKRICSSCSGNELDKRRMHLSDSEGSDLDEDEFEWELDDKEYVPPKTIAPPQKSQHSSVKNKPQSNSMQPEEHFWRERFDRVREHLECPKCFKPAQFTVIKQTQGDAPVIKCKRCLSSARGNLVCVTIKHGELKARLQALSKESDQNTMGTTKVSRELDEIKAIAKKALDKVAIVEANARELRRPTKNIP